MLCAICEWSNRANFLSGKPLSTERSIPLLFFLISPKILRCNILRSKHPIFFCLLNGDTLARCVLFFITNEADIFPLTLTMLPNIELSSHFFVSFLHFSFFGGVHATSFTKPAVS